MQKNIRVRNLARQRRLLNPGLSVVGIATAMTRKVPTSRTLRPIADFKTRHIDKLRVLQIEPGPSRKRHPQLRLRSVAPAIRKVRSQDARVPRRRARRHRRHRAVRVPLAVDRRPRPRCRHLVRARRIQIHCIAARARPNHHRVPAGDAPPQRMRCHAIRPQIPQPTRRARPIHTAPRIRRIMTPVALPTRCRRSAHKWRSPIRPHVPRRPSLTPGHHPNLNHVPRRTPARQTAAAKARRPASPARHTRRSRRPCR